MLKVISKQRTQLVLWRRKEVGGGDDSGVKVFVIQPDDPSLIPRSHIMQGWNQFLQIVP